MSKKSIDSELSVAMKKYLIGKEMLTRLKTLEDAYIAAAEKSDVEYISAHKLNCKGSVAEDLGRECHIASSTVITYSKFAVAIDSLREKNEDLASQILSGEVQMSYRDITQLINVL